MADFRLSRLLKIRRLEDDQASAELAAANRRAHENEFSVARARRVLAAFGDEATSVDALRAIAAARGAAATLLSELSDRRAADEQTLVDAQDRHREARRRSRALSKLEERWSDGQLADELAREQAQLDDLPRSASRVEPASHEAQSGAVA